MEIENQNIKRSYKIKLLEETALYGLLAAIYTSLFFFGALYPEYGVPAQCIEAEDQTEDCDEEWAEDTEQGIVYKSLFWQRIREWF